MALVDDEPRRTLMGKTCRERIEQELAWHHQQSAYLGVYERVLSEGMTALKRTRSLRCAGSRATTSKPTVECWSRSYWVDRASQPGYEQSWNHRND